MTYKQQMDNAILSTISTEQSKRNLREWNPYHPPAQTPLFFSSSVFRDMLKERRLTYKQMGKMCGLSESFIAEVSKGITAPSEATKEKLAIGLGCEVDDFMVICDFEA